MNVNYCHNCGHHSELPDGTYCTWCLSFFSVAGRLPRPNDTLPAHDAMAEIRRTLGWNRA